MGYRLWAVGHRLSAIGYGLRGVPDLRAPVLELAAHITQPAIRPKQLLVRRDRRIDLRTCDVQYDLQCNMQYDVQYDVPMRCVRIGRPRFDLPVSPLSRWLLPIDILVSGHGLLECNRSTTTTSVEPSCTPPSRPVASACRCTMRCTMLARVDVDSQQLHLTFLYTTVPAGCSCASMDGAANDACIAAARSSGGSACLEQYADAQCDA